MQEFVTHSREETVAVGRELAKTLPAGALIAFTGGLGAGKTAFCQGLAEGLEVWSCRSVSTGTEPDGLYWIWLFLQDQYICCSCLFGKDSDLCSDPCSIIYICSCFFK